MWNVAYSYLVYAVAWETFAQKLPLARELKFLVTSSEWLAVLHFAVWEVKSSI